jgi:hypothetical protein
LQVVLDHLPAQDDYFNATEDQVAFVGGIGTGKTHVACDDILRTAATYPKCGGSEPGIAIFSNTYPQLIAGTMRTFFERCDHWGIRYLNRIRTLHKVYLVDFDCWIGVWSVDEPENFRSLEFCHVWIDEAKEWSKDAYDVVVGRLRGTATQRKLYPSMPLCARITSNPPHTLDHWLVDLCTVPDPNTGKPPIRLITAATTDNPFLPADYIRRARANYDPEVAEIELGGKFGDIGRGRIWRMFSRGKHVLSQAKAAELGLPTLDYERNLPLCLGQDFNIDPLCSVLFQWRRVNAPGYQLDVMYVLDEMYIRNSQVHFVAEELRNRPAAYATARRNGIILYGDAAGNQGNRQTGRSDWDVMKESMTNINLAGTARVRAADPDRKLRFNSGNRMLMDANGKIGVVIHERCVNLVQDLERMYFKPGTALVDIPKIKDGKLKRLYTHLADAWSYAIEYDYPIRDMGPAPKLITQR